MKNTSLLISIITLTRENVDATVISAQITRNLQDRNKWNSLMEVRCTMHLLNQASGVYKNYEASLRDHFDRTL